MHETDGDAHVANQFDEGDPGVPRAPTQVDKHWLNAVQNELVNAIEAAGITLVKGTWTQLRDAMGLNSGSPGLIARFFSNTLNINPTGTLQALVASAATTSDSSGTVKATTTGLGPAVNAISNGGGGSALRAEGDANTSTDPAIDIAAGIAKFSGANLSDAAGHTNALSAIGLVKGWAHFAWSNGAPTLASGMNMAAPGNPAAGQIQVNLTDAIGSGHMVCIGLAGPGQGYKIVPLNGTGLLQLEDQAGTAIAFGATTGFAYVAVLGRQ